MKKAKSANQVTDFQQIINVGPAFAEDFQVLGVTKPQALIGKDPAKLYQQLCVKTKTFHDPCVLDTFMAVVDFMEGGEPQKWFAFTAKRKQKHAALVDRLHNRFPPSS